MNDRELDAEFERIVAGWDDEAPDPLPARPSESLPPVQPAAPAAPTDEISIPIAPTTAHVWRGQEPPVDDVDEVLDESDDDHFVPPTEMELPTAEDDPMFWAILGSLVGGPLLLLYVVIFDREGSGWWVVTAIALIIVGFVLLVLRGGSERDPFDDGTRI